MKKVVGQATLISSSGGSVGVLRVCGGVTCVRTLKPNGVCRIQRNQSDEECQYHVYGAA
jgi:hypothetical protein